MVIYTPPSVAKDIPVIDLAESFSHDIEKEKLLRGKYIRQHVKLASFI